jgi:hypothetical protein
MLCSISRASPSTDRSPALSEHIDDLCPAPRANRLGYGRERVKERGLGYP